jgi:hypothetical protein
VKNIFCNFIKSQPQLSTLRLIKNDIFTNLKQKKINFSIQTIETMKPKHLNFIFLFLVASLIGCNTANEGLYDEQAIEALDKLSETIGDMNSCSFSLFTETVKHENDELVTSYKQNDVYMGGADKMYFYAEKQDSRKGFWYNGSQLAVFLYDENQYDIVNAPGSILETIDSLNKHYNIEFPAGDFFYPTLTDDLIAQFDTIVALDSRTIDEVSCIEINATNQNLDVYILIEEETYLPKQLEIYYLKPEKKGESYVSTFSYFRYDPDLPDELFKFSPPSNAVKASLFK